MSRLLSPPLRHPALASAQARRPFPATSRAQPTVARPIAGSRDAEQQRRAWQDGLSCALLLALSFAVWQFAPERAAAGSALAATVSCRCGPVRGAPGAARVPMNRRPAA